MPRKVVSLFAATPVAVDVTSFGTEQSCENGSRPSLRLQCSERRRARASCVFEVNADAAGQQIALLGWPLAMPGRSAVSRHWCLLLIDGFPASPHTVLTKEMHSKAVALVLGILSFVPPFSGLARFYLKRNPTGVIFTLPPAAALSEISSTSCRYLSSLSGRICDRPKRE